MSTSDIKMPWWAWGVAAAVLVAALGAVVTAANWVGASIVTHGNRIENHEVRITMHDKVMERMDDKLDRILEELRKK